MYLSIDDIVLQIIILYLHTVVLQLKERDCRRKINIFYVTKTEITYKYICCINFFQITKRFLYCKSAHFQLRYQTIQSTPFSYLFIRLLVNALFLLTKFYLSLDLCCFFHLDICLIFFLIVQKEKKKGLICFYYRGLLLYPDGPFNVEKDSGNISELFRPFCTLLFKIR